MNRLPVEIWTDSICPFLESAEFHAVASMMRVESFEEDKAVKQIETNLRAIGRLVLQNLNTDIDKLDNMVFRLLESSCQNHLLFKRAFLLDKTSILPGKLSLLLLRCHEYRHGRMKTAPPDLLELGYVKVISVIMMHRYMTQSRERGSIHLCKALLKYRKQATT